MKDIFAVAYSGLKFVMDQRKNKDLRPYWEEFHELNRGASDVWISAYILRCLSSLNFGSKDPQGFGDNAERQLSQSWSFIEEHQHSDLGFGYNKHCPSDADSTANVLGIRGTFRDWQSWRIQKAPGFLTSYQREDGGIATYKEDQVRWLYKDNAKVLESGVQGWCSSHDCVTGLVGQLRDIPHDNFCKLVNYLREKQDPKTGLWEGYWWATPNYATLQALKTFDRVKEGANHQDKIVASLKATPLSDAFSVGLAVEALVLLKKNWYDFKHLIDWLADSQLKDGGWSASPTLRIPRPHMVNPDETTEVLLDHKRCLSTIAAVCALAAWLKNS